MIMNMFDLSGMPQEYQRFQKLNYWKTAIGLQAVDGLQPSDCLYELAGKHIDGVMDIKEVQRTFHSYYDTEKVQTVSETADKVSANAVMLLEDNRFCLSADEFRSIHESLFGGVYRHAGNYRTVKYRQVGCKLHLFIN